MKTKAKPRLKKGPDIQDYVVESIYQDSERLQTSYQYFVTRKEAREFAKAQVALRTRIFRIKYTLVSDSKKKVRK